MKQANYLGLIINDRGRWDTHVNNVTEKAFGIFAKLRPIMRRRSNLPLNLKRLLCLTIVRPILTYASPAWAPRDTETLQIFQNKVLREIVGASESEMTWSTRIWKLKRSIIILITWMPNFSVVCWWTLNLGKPILMKCSEMMPVSDP